MKVVYCLRCGKPLPEGRRKWCSRRCLERSWDAAHREQKSTWAHNWRKAHPGYYDGWHRAFWRKMRHEALLLVGRGEIRCRRCGITDERIMEINHVNGGGRKHNRSHLDYGVVRGKQSIEDLELACKVCNIAHYVELVYPEYKGRIKVSYVEPIEVLA